MLATGTGRLQDSLDCRMVGVDMHIMAIDIGVEMPNSPHDSKSFKFGDRILFLSGGECTTSVCYRVKFPITTLLREDSTQSHCTGICLQGETLLEIGVLKNRSVR